MVVRVLLNMDNYLFQARHRDSTHRIASTSNLGVSVAVRSHLSMVASLLREYNSSHNILVILPRISKTARVRFPLCNPFKQLRRLWQQYLRNKRAKHPLKLPSHFSQTLYQRLQRLHLPSQVLKSRRLGCPS